MESNSGFMLKRLPAYPEINGEFELEMIPAENSVNPSKSSFYYFGQVIGVIDWWRYTTIVALISIGIVLHDSIVFMT